MQPEKLGPFQIGRVLGRGGMGVVYEGTHEKTGETAAVKVLISTLEDDSEIRLRFEAEIDTLKRLRHPNIVRLFGFGEEQGMLYYVMEMVDGPSLHQEMRRKRFFQWHEVAKIGLEMCLALKHGHDRGITHRDIKPANILLERHGSIKLSDYGIAQFFGGQRLTEVNSVVGTLEYMSPEQSLANPVGPRSDIYSLGTVLYALLVGKPPYTARNLAEIVRKHQKGAVESIRTTRLDVPEDLEAILLDLLRIKPEERPQNTYLVAKRFQSLLQALVGPPERILVKPMDPNASTRTSIQEDEKNGRGPDFSNGENVIDLGALGPESGEKLKEKNIKLTIESDPADSASIASSFGDLGSDLNPTRTVSVDIGTFPDSIYQATTIGDDDFDLNASTAFSMPKDDDLARPEPVDPKEGLVLADAESKSASPSDPMVADPHEIQTERITGDDVPNRSKRKSALPDSSSPPEPSRDVPTVGGLESLPEVLLSKPVEDASAPYALQQSPTPFPATSATAAATLNTKTSRFVPVKEEELDDFDERDKRHRPIVSIQTVLASVCLILIGLIVWYLLQPVLPDTLYARIEQTIESGRAAATEEGDDDEISRGALRRAEVDIRDFLKQYAGHPKADQVRFYEDKLEIANLERKLERQKTLSPPERAYLEAIAAAKTDPETAIKKLRALINLFGSDAVFLTESRETSATDTSSKERHPMKRLSGPTELCVELARRRLVQLEKNLATINAEQIALLEIRLNDADALEQEHPERAEAIRRGLIELYGDRSWAKEVVRRARSKLKN